MVNWKSIVMSVALCATFSADADCYLNGDTLTLQGVAVFDGNKWFLGLNTPLCVSMAPTDLKVERIQVIGSPPPEGVPLELTGRIKISPDQTASMTVINGRKLSTNPPAQATPYTAVSAIEQRQADARAAVLETWDSYKQAAGAIETGKKCGIITGDNAGMTYLQLQRLMNNDLIRAGLVGDPSPGIRQALTNIVAAGKANAETINCEALSPAQRGRLRMLISDLQP